MSEDKISADAKKKREKEIEEEEKKSMIQVILISFSANLSMHCLILYICILKTF